MSRPQKREDIGLLTVKRLIGAGAEIKDVRVSAEAIEEARNAVMHYITKAGDDAKKLLKFKKAKTVSAEIAQMVLMNKCAGIDETDLLGGHEVGTRGLPVAACDRIFRGELGGDRTSAKAKKMVTFAAEAYLRNLGLRAGMMAKAGKRVTILKNDVIDARKLLA